MHMGESVGMSISFGKYENDALSWEKWSTFSPNNKYLEEVGKCSTPGSVAQKKAFFEAHYKKIAAMKAQLLASELDDHTEQEIEEDCTQVNEEPDIKVSEDEQVNDEGFQEEDVLLPSQSTIILSSDADILEETIIVNNESMKQVGDKDVQHLLPETLSSINVDMVDEAVLVNNESMKQVGNEDVQHLLPITLNSSVDKLDEAVLVNKESMKLVKQHFQVDLETEEDRKEMIMKPQNVTPKIYPNKVETNSIGMKKKPASFVPKSPGTPVSSRLSEPKPRPKPTSTSSLKASTLLSSLSSSKNKYHSVSESRRVAPVSHHLSISMNSVNSDTASSVTLSRRRSLFMEQMGDKDIVKRAFKTFQNRINPLPSYDTGPKQLPTKRSEQKPSTSRAYQKENERSKKVVEKINPTRGQLGPTRKSVSSGSLKDVGVNERRLNPGPTSIALKSKEKAERRKEFFKNLEEKSNAREAERCQLSIKSKEVKDDAEIKKLKPNLSSKAKRVPSFSQSHAALTNTSVKETIKSGNKR